MPRSRRRTRSRSHDCAGILGSEVGRGEYRRPYHPLRALAALGFTDPEAPLLEGAKLPPRKVSSQRSSPSSSRPPKSARHAASQLPPSCCHCCNRRQQVEGDGNASGKTAKRPQFAESRECPRSRPDSRPAVARVGRVAASASGTTARSAPTAHRSTASAVAYPKCVLP